MQHLARFRRGLSVVMKEQDFLAYTWQEEVLGAPTGQYAVPKEWLDEYLATKPTSSQLAEKLGHEVDKFGDTRNVFQVDYDFSFNENPRLPTGTEIGTNGKFIKGGFTSGRVPEIITDPIPRSKISWNVISDSLGK